MKCDKECPCSKKCSDKEYASELPSWVYFGIGLAIGAVMWLSIKVGELFVRLS